MRPSESEPSAHCGCETGAESGGRKSVGVDPEIKDRNLKRLRRFDGQILGVQKMVAEERSWTEFLLQVSSAHEALRAVGREVMRNHLRHCVAQAGRAGGPEAEATYDELLDLMYTYSR